MSYRRALSASEARFAENRSTVAYSVFGTGRLDLDALTTAFGALLRTYPVLAGRIVPSPDGYVLEPARREPDVRIGTGPVDRLPAGGYAVVDTDAVCAIDVSQRQDAFRLALSTHHSIADAGASMRYLETLCALYTTTVETGSPGPLVTHPLPLSLEEFLTARGFELPAAPAVRPAPAPELDARGAEPAPAVLHGRTRLGRRETARLFEIARNAGLTVHGIVCAAILLAAHDLSREPGPVPFRVESSVDLRTRTGPALPAEAGTVIQGSDGAVVLVEPNDDPIRLGRAVLRSLAHNLAKGLVHTRLLRSQDLRGRGAEPPLMVTNWGRVPPLHLPEGVRVHDFRASASGARAGVRRVRSAPPSFFVTTCGGQLSLDHPAWVSDGSDPTVAQSVALAKAFERILR